MSFIIGIDVHEQGVAAHGFSIWAESHNKCRMSPTNTNTSVKFDRIPCNALDAMSPCADQPGGI